KEDAERERRRAEHGKQDARTAVFTSYSRLHLPVQHRRAADGGGFVRCLFVLLRRLSVLLRSRRSRRGGLFLFVLSVFLFFAHNDRSSVLSRFWSGKSFFSISPTVRTGTSSILSSNFLTLLKF